MNKILQKYTDPSQPGSFSGVRGFLKNNFDTKFNKNKLSKELTSLPSYSLHKPARKKFKRNRVLVTDKDEQWQIDLVDMTEQSGSNYQIQHLLTCIDVFTKFAWVRPLHNKASETVSLAFKDILEESNRKPKLIYSDKGNEFGGAFAELCDKLGITIYLTKSPYLKAVVVERFNRTFKSKLIRYLTHRSYTVKNNLKKNYYLADLQKLVDSYNNTYHTSIKTTPKQASNNISKEQIFINLYGYTNNEKNETKDYGDPDKITFKFEKGMYVRTSRHKSLFEKSYTAGWSTEIYVIDQQLATNPPKYKLINLDNGTLVNGTFYNEELNYVNDKQFPYDTFRIESENQNTYKVKQLNTNIITPPQEQIKKPRGRPKKSEQQPKITTTIPDIRKSGRDRKKVDRYIAT